MQDLTIPEIGSKWRHREKDTIYTVVLITNLRSTRPQEFPITVSYVDEKDLPPWSCFLTRWHEKMELCNSGL